MGKGNIIYGRKVIREVINSGVIINKFYINEKINMENIKDILDYAINNGIEVKYVKYSDLDVLCNNNVHQGVIGKIGEYRYFKFKECLKSSKEEKSPFILILDSIQDPRNLGAILRTAEGMGIKNIIIPQKRSSSITDIVWKSSMGAIGNLNICRTNNITHVISELKYNGFKLIATTLSTNKVVEDYNYAFPVALIIGNEEHGVSQGLLELCDIKIKIPMQGKINSFNVSVASGIIMYTIKSIRKEF